MNASTENFDTSIISKTANEDIQNGKSLSALNSKSEKPDTEDDRLLLSFISKRFDDLVSNIVNGVTNFSNKDLSMICRIYALFDTLMVLRKGNDALDSVIKDLEVAYAHETVTKRPGNSPPTDMNKCSSTNDLSIPAKELDHSAKIVSTTSEASKYNVADDSKLIEEDPDEITDLSSESSESDADGFNKLNYREKMTCVCVICDKQIDIPPDVDIQFVMEEHIQSYHPFVHNSLDYAMDREDGNKSDEESESPDDPTILLDGTKLADFKVKFTGTQIALKYIFQSNGILRTKNNTFICIICDIYMPLEKYISFHLTSKMHRARINEYAGYSAKAKKNRVVNVDPDIFVIRQNRLYCLECQFFLLNTHIFLKHLSDEHNQKLKLDFPVTNIDGREFCALCDHGESNRRKLSKHLTSKEHYVKYLEVLTVIQLRSIKFCSLCSVKLFTECEYNSHVNGSGHFSNLLKFKDLVDGLRLKELLK